MQYASSRISHDFVAATASLFNVWDMVKHLEKDEKGKYPETRMLEVCVLSKAKGGSRE
jgi:cyclic pyranopterin phosphate synthase